MKNIEVKARVADLTQARDAAQRLGAKEVGVFRQVDTFFRVPAGRLKLRQNEPGEDEIIFYQRPDQAGARASDFDLVQVMEPERLRALLSSALGALVEVRKQRELWLVDNVRIHLDTVDKLGTFVEFEVEVNADHPEADCWEQARWLMREFGLGPGDLVAGAYADLLSRGQ